MRRLFLSVYVVVVVALVGSVASLKWLLDHDLRNALIRSAEQTALSAQYLFEKEVSNLPVAQWPQRIGEVSEHFGYQLDLLTLPQIEASPRNQERLRQGLPALDEQGDDIRYMLLPLRGSEHIVRAYIEQPRHENAIRSLIGFYYLFDQQLANASSEQRIAQLRDAEERFGYPIRSVPVSIIPDAENRRRVRAGELIVIDQEGPEERYYKLLAGEDRALQLGPFPRYFLERAIDYLIYAALAMALGVGLYFWARPLWRDMLSLERSAEAIGQGKLDTRVRVSKGSAIHGVAETFNSMAQRVQELLRAHKETTDAISHELRTPISRMRFGVEMVETTSVPEDRARYLVTMRNALDELEALVDESLTYSRLTSTTRRLSPEIVNLAEWIRGIVDDEQPFAGTPRVHSETVDPHAEAYFDSRFVGRALQNIIRNAIRHARTTVKICVRQDSQYTDFIVEDDGPGIPKEHRTAIFEPFYRLDDSRQRESGGYGLGLAIVMRICEWTHAEVKVEDSALGGALFRLRWLTSEIAVPEDSITVPIGRADPDARSVEPFRPEAT